MDPSPEDVQAFKRVATNYGARGGKARAKKLTKKRRQEIARQAAQARWSKDRKLA